MHVKINYSTDSSSEDKAPKKPVVAVKKTEPVKAAKVINDPTLVVHLLYYSIYTPQVAKGLSFQFFLSTINYYYVNIYRPRKSPPLLLIPRPKMKPPKNPLYLSRKPNQLILPLRLLTTTPSLYIYYSLYYI